MEEKDFGKEFEKVKAFVDYYECKKNKQFNNAFHILNTGETSISDLLTWLLDTNWVKENEIPENQIHRNFTYEFLKLIQEKSIEQNNGENVWEKYNDENKLKELANGIVAIPNKDDMDIILVNKDEKFLCVIENKKRAKLSCPETTCRLQIEKYYNNIIENKVVIKIKNEEIKYEKFNKIFIYLCANIEDTEKTIEERLSDVKSVPEAIQQNLIFKNLRYNDFKDMRIAQALNDLNYTIVEHSDVTLILYQILLKLCPKKFDKNGILKAIDRDEMIAITTKMLNLYRNPEKYLNPEENKISGNAKMRFYYNFSEKFDYEERLDILCQYIEYWELHNGEQSLGDYLYGYTKIVNGEYIWNICKKLKENENDWKQVKELGKQSQELNAIIKEIEEQNK